jgi:hypothetical protein
LKLEWVCYTIVACAILHNICKPANDPDLEEDQDDVNEEEEAEVEVVQQTRLLEGSRERF